MAHALKELAVSCVELSVVGPLEAECVTLTQVKAIEASEEAHSIRRLKLFYWVEKERVAQFLFDQVESL